MDTDKLLIQSKRFVSKRRLKMLLTISEEANKKEYSFGEEKGHSIEYMNMLESIDKAINEEAKYLAALEIAQKEENCGEKYSSISFKVKSSNNDIEQIAQTIVKNLNRHCR